MIMFIRHPDGADVALASSSIVQVFRHPAEAGLTVVMLGKDHSMTVRHDFRDVLAAISNDQKKPITQVENTAAYEQSATLLQSTL